MNKVPARIFIYSKDVENITGRRSRTCRAIIRKIKIHFSKQPSDPVTVKEFCEFMNIKEDLIKDFLID